MSRALVPAAALVGLLAAALIAAAALAACDSGGERAPRV
jgi:hypothetical protein